MKILILSTYDNGGGAAKAGYRILNALRKLNVFAEMLVKSKRTENPHIHEIKGVFKPFFNLVTPFFDRLPLIRYKNAKTDVWNTGWFPNPGLLSKIKEFAPDLVQIHWVSHGFVPINVLKNIKKPLVWRLSDSWAFTGGCHIPFDCKNYISNCQNCPQLNSGLKTDLAKSTLKKKQKHWKNLNLTIVAPSNWMAECAQNSALFNNRKIAVIYPGVDTDIFVPRNKTVIKKELNLQVDKRYIVFGGINATKDVNKGFQLLKQALHILKGKLAESFNIEILVLGGTEPEIPIDLGFKISYVGTLKDEISLALYYSIAEIFVLPSLIDNSPNAVIESLSCGIPVVAFGVCGALDMIDHKTNGYLANPYSAEDLSNGINWILNENNATEYDELSKNARLKVLNEFEITEKAKEYQMLYEEILKHTRL